MGLKRFVSPRASRVYKFRYENPDWLMESGKPHYRTIQAVAGEGRFKRGSEAEALELAERRLSEQFGDALLESEQAVRESGRVGAGWTDPAADRVRAEPMLHQKHYVLVSVKRVK